MANGDNSILVEVKSLWKKYFYTYALKDIDFTIRRSEHTLILGANGSGKSTLVKILVGLVKPTKGYVRVLGRNPFREYKSLSERIGVLLDNHVLPWWMSGYEFLEYVSKIKRIEWSIISELAELLRANTYWHRKIFTYSEGMKKKIALIQALACAKDLLILDDPFAFLDRETRKILANILKELAERTTIVVTTHVLGGIQHAFKKALVLDAGKKVYEGDVNGAIKGFSDQDINNM